jgi:hypothetical protein
LRREHRRGKNVDAKLLKELAEGKKLDKIKRKLEARGIDMDGPNPLMGPWTETPQ